MYVKVYVCPRGFVLYVYGMYIREDRYNMYICVMCVYVYVIPIMCRVYLYCPRCTLDASFECPPVRYMYAVYL